MLHTLNRGATDNFKTPPGDPVAAARRFQIVITAMILVLLLAMLLDVWTGQADVEKTVTPAVVLQVIWHHVSGNREHFQIPYADSIVWQIRLPRAVAATIVGALLALVGTAFQCLLMNPLADPYTVGVASGAGLRSVTVILLGGASLLSGYAQPVAAFVGGLLAVATVYKLAYVGGRASPHTFLLAGTVVGAFFWSMIPLSIMMSSQAGENREIRVMSALFGSLAGIGWHRLYLMLIPAVLGSLILIRYSHEMDIMATGEEMAAHLGVNTANFMRRTLAIGTLLTATAVAFVGIIAFVGFVGPHIARRLVGPRHSYLMPVSALVGAVLLIMADWLARVFLNDLQVGVVTAFFGIPLYAALFRKSILPQSSGS